MIRTSNRSLVVCLAATLAPCSFADASQVGVIEDFQGAVPTWGVEQQYGIGAAVVQADGGPAGAGDAFLVYTSSGSGRGGARMVLPADIFAGPAWGGDYVGAGVTGLTADVANPGDTPLSLRLAVSAASASYVSTEPVVIPAGADWMSVAFQLDQALFTNLTLNEAQWPLSRVLGAVDDIRLLTSDSLPTLGNPYPQGDLVAAQIAVDNIRLVPEPGASALALLAALWGGGARRRSLMASRL